jgi:zinc protease
MRNFFRFVAWACWSLSVLGAAPANSAEPASEFSLENGLRVVVVPDHRVPVVAHMIWYRAGAADDPAGKSGIAHFLEHLMFKSTAALKSGQFAVELNRLGGRGNAQTNQDTTVYFERVPRDSLRAVMALEADRMMNLRLQEDEVRTERDVILEERRSTIDGNPVKVMGEQMLATLYLNHPYRRPPIGWGNEMATLSQADALTFYKRFYGPDNATVVVAGDVTEREVRIWSEETYGKNKQAAVPMDRMRPQEPRRVTARRVVLERPGSATLLRYYLTPSYASALPNEAASLELLAQILGGDDGARLYRALEARKLASSAGVDYIGNALEGGRLAFIVEPFTASSMADAEAVIDDVIVGMREGELTNEELDLAKSTLDARETFARDDLLSLARLYGEAAGVGRSVEDVEALSKRRHDVTVDEVRQAAKVYLDPARSVTGMLVPPKASKP